PVSTSDFYPTLLAVTNTVMENQPPLDGENILPVLEGKNNRRGPIGFMSPLPSPLKKQETRVEEQFALVDRQYKIISVDDGITYQLYDLILDESETTDISHEHPDLYNDMKNVLLSWVRACRQDSILSR
ncbi:MAG: hypothetical protein IH593_05595, partial [Bacteroidales bacterium]|nr:hypothetical protein [Bacteroidales bacterium]